MEINTPSCIPPRILLCRGEPPGEAGPGYVFCLCEVPANNPPPKPTCYQGVQWVKDDPRAVWMNKPEPGCEASMEIALAFLLAQILRGAMP